jgi:hypothetical protein
VTWDSSPSSNETCSTCSCPSARASPGVSEDSHHQRRVGGNFP